MRTTYQPIFIFIICILTISVSFYVAYEITGSIFGKARVIHLAEYGGLTIESINNLEFWRFITSQLIHVHQKHMIYNVLSLLLLGLMVERRVGFGYTFAIWLFAGGLGTWLSVQLGTPPWDTGTGASQAAFGFSGFLVVLALQKIDNIYLILMVLLFALIPSLYLDFKAVGYPKLGHCLSFIVGCCMAIYYFYKIKKPHIIKK